VSTLEIFCRQVKLLLNPGLIREKIESQNGTRSFCELCVKDLSEALDNAQGELRQAA